MIGWPSAKREVDSLEKLRAIKVGGFRRSLRVHHAGIDNDRGELGLRLMSGFDAKSVADAMPRLGAQRDAGVRFINIQLLNHDTPPRNAAAVAVKLIRASRKLGLAVHIETHRDTSTETPEKFDEIARLYKQATEN